MRRRAKLVGAEWERMVKQEISREPKGHVPVKTPHVVFRIESWVASTFASLFDVGWGFGLAALVFRRRVHAPAYAPARASFGAPGRSPSRRFWFVFAGAIVLSFFVHEVGRCVVAWFHGCPAIPTPAKEYFLRPLHPEAQYVVALGGVLGSVAVLAGAVHWLYRRPSPATSVIFC